MGELARSQVAQLAAEKAEMMVSPPVQQIQMAGNHKVSVLGSGAGNIIVNPKAAPEDQPHEIVKIGPKSKMGPKSKLGPKSKMGPKSVIESPASSPPPPSSEPEKEDEPEDVSMFPDMNDFFVKTPTMGPKSKKAKMGPASKMGPKSKIGPKSKMGPKSAVQSPETNGDNGEADHIELPGVPDFTGLSPMPLGALADSSEKLEKLKSIALKFPGSSPKKKPATPKTPKTPKEPKPPRERSFGANGINPIVFEKTYECVGTWKKTIQARSTGNHVDPYLYPPDGKKLRSGNELIDYISKNPQFWADFDPVVINFERSEDAKMGGASKKLIKFLDLARNGSTPSDNFATPKIKIGPKSKMSGDGGASFGKIKIGPKSKMAKLEGKLNREVNALLMFSIVD